METFTYLMQGFAHALTLNNLYAAVIGVTLGTFAGMMPGLGISGTIALLLPISYGLDPLTALIIFAGIYYGAMYGGSTTAILINVPGEGPSVITCIEGHAMARRGRAGAALAVAAIGSFLAGTIGLIGLMFFAPAIANAALAFGPPEYFSMAVLALVVLSGITGESMLRSSLMVFGGVMIGTVGIDPMTGVERYTLSYDWLLDGISFIVVVMGAYGLGEVLEAIVERRDRPKPSRVRLRDLYPTRDELARSFPAIFRGGIIGFLVGLVPGPSGTISSFLSYSAEKRFSRGREEFGSGAIEGVAGPESANNASESSTLIPLLALGLPFSSSAAMLLSGFMIHGITPGPFLIASHPDVFWGLIAGMFIANLFLLIINLPMVGIFASLLAVPLRVLMPIVTMLIVIGAYALRSSLFDVWLAAGFGVVGFLLRKTGYSIVPMVIGLFLGPMIEKGLAQSMTLVDGSFINLMSRPLSGLMLGAAALFVAGKAILFLLRRFRHQALRASPRTEEG